MERQSPLALSVAFQLMKMGSLRLASMDQQIKLETTAQRSLMMKPDFKNWQEHVRQHGGDEGKAPPFTGWQHPNVKAVTATEVDEVLATETTK
jgi:hypothetical protein